MFRKIRVGFENTSDMRRAGGDGARAFLQDSEGDQAQQSRLGKLAGRWNGFWSAWGDFWARLSGIMALAVVFFLILRIEPLRDNFQSLSASDPVSYFISLALAFGLFSFSFVAAWGELNWHRNNRFDTEYILLFVLFVFGMGLANYYVPEYLKGYMQAFAFAVFCIIGVFGVLAGHFVNAVQRWEVLPFGLDIVSLSIIFAVTTVLFILAGAFSVELESLIGLRQSALSYALMAFACIMPLLAGMFILQWYKWPVLAFLVVFLALGILAGDPILDPLPLRDFKEGRNEVSLGDVVKTAPAGEPVTVAALPGGGISTAYAGAFFLHELQRHYPDVYRSLKAVSAVSGGAVGTAVYDASARIPGVKRVQVLEETLSQDYLSAPVWRLTGPTLLQYFEASFRAIVNIVVWPIEKLFNEDYTGPEIPPQGERGWGDRSLSIENKLRKRWQGALDLYAPDMSRDYWDNALSGDTRDFVTVYNAFSIEQKQRVLLSNATLGETENALSISDLAEPGYDISKAEAALLSARFPFITPPAYVADMKGKFSGQMVDGGYFDNSGLVTAHDLAAKIQGMETADGAGREARILALQPFSALLPVNFETGDKDWKAPAPNSMETGVLVDAAFASRSANARERLVRFDAALSEPCSGGPTCLKRLIDRSVLAGSVSAHAVQEADIFERTKEDDLFALPSTKSARWRQGQWVGVRFKAVSSSLKSLAKGRGKSRRERYLKKLEDGVAAIASDMEEGLEGIGRQAGESAMPGPVDVNGFSDLLIYFIDDTEAPLPLNWHLPGADRARIRGSYLGMGQCYAFDRVFEAMADLYADIMGRAVGESVATLNQVVALARDGDEEGAKLLFHGRLPEGEEASGAVLGWPNFLAHDPLAGKEAEPAWYHLREKAGRLMHARLVENRVLNREFPVKVIERMTYYMGGSDAKSRMNIAYLYAANTANCVLASNWP